MDFDKAVAAFQRKKNARVAADQKREAYKAVLKDYQGLKYAPAVGGVRKEREITQELIERKAEEKKAVEIDTIADSLVDFVDITLPPEPPKVAPKKGKRK